MEPLIIVIIGFLLFIAGYIAGTGDEQQRAKHRAQQSFDRFVANEAVLAPDSEEILAVCEWEHDWPDKPYGRGRLYDYWECERCGVQRETLPGERP